MVIKSEKENKSVYGDGPSENTIERHVLSVLVKNEPGVLARVVGLFSGRGYNIESLTVAVVSKKLQQSRMTIVTTGTANIIEQIKKQLGRLVPVYTVTDLTEEGPNVERDHALIKVVEGGKKRDDVMKIANKFDAQTVETTDESFVFEITSTPEKVSQFIELMIPLGVVNISRTGSAAVSLGQKRF